MPNLKIYKRFRAHPDDLKKWGDPLGWFESTVEDCLEYTEGAGYYKPGTVLDLLQVQPIVVTPFAEYMADPVIESPLSASRILADERDADGAINDGCAKGRRSMTLEFSFAEEFADDLTSQKEAAYWQAMETLVLIARKEYEREENKLEAPTSLLVAGKAASESVDGEPGDSAARAGLPVGKRLGSANKGVGIGGTVRGAAGPGPVLMV